MAGCGRLSRSPPSNAHPAHIATLGCGWVRCFVETLQGFAVFARTDSHGTGIRSVSS